MLLEAHEVDALALEEITNAAAAEALVPEWRELSRRCPTATPFQSPEWCLAWWRHCAGGEGLWLLALRKAGRLVAVAPFFLWSDPHRKVCLLRCLGAGLGDLIDLLIEPTRAASARQRIAQHLSLARRTWDVGEFEPLRPCAELLAMPTPDCCETEITPGETCPVVELAFSDGEAEPALPPRWRRRLDYDARRLARLGRVDFVRAEDATFDELFAALVRLHGERWARQGQPGVLSAPAVTAFHREAARGLLESGVLRLFALRLDGRIVASYYGFLFHGVAYYYLGGFDPTFGRWSPGHQMVRFALEEARREGASRLEFLRGAEAYKYRWGARDLPTFRRRLSAPGGDCP